MKKSPKPIVHVAVGDTTRPVRFGFNALADFCDAAGLTLADLQALDFERLGVADLRALYWAGFKDGARKEGAPFERADGGPVTPEDVGDWMDEIDDAEGARILGAFADAQGAGEGGPGKPEGAPKAAPKRKAKR